MTIPNEIVDTTRQVNRANFYTRCVRPLGLSTAQALARHLPHGVYLSRTGDRADYRARWPIFKWWVVENTTGLWILTLGNDGRQWHVNFAREQDAVLCALRFPQGLDGPDGFD